MTGGTAAMSSAAPRHRLLVWIDRSVGALACLGILVMLASAVAQVVLRYLLSAPPSWTEELARYAMVWGGLLGAASTFYAGADPVLTRGFADRADWTGVIAAWARCVGVLIFVGPITYHALVGPGMDFARGYVARSHGRTAEALEVPMSTFTTAIPVAFGLIALYAVATLVARLLRRRR